MMGHICANDGLALYAPLILLLLNLPQSYGTNIGLKLLDDCVCYGYNVTYECITMGPGSTIFIVGSAQECEIDLRHSQFDSGAAFGRCMNGAVIGRGIQTDGTFYTSHLTVLVNSNFLHKMVSCEHYNGLSQTIIDSIPLTLTMSSDPPPPPQLAPVNVTVNDRAELVFEWISLNITCPLLRYDTRTMNCGTCVDGSSTTVCFDFVLGLTDNICRYSVQSVICGNVTGNASTSYQLINLRVPDAPVIEVVPLYQSSGQSSILKKLVTTFIQVESFMISSGIDGSMISYNITYSDLTFGSTCSSSTIAAYSCENGLCRHELDIFESSFCPPRSGIIVTVFASNALGRGPTSAGVSRDGVNSLVNVTFDSIEKVIVCNFSKQLNGSVKNCSANITYGPNCDKQVDVYSGIGMGDSVITNQIKKVPKVDKYCYLVTATSSNVTVVLEDKFDYVNIAPDYTTVYTLIIVVALLLVCGALIIIFIAVFLTLFYKYSRKLVKIGFSVADTPGSLSKAIKVFKVHKVNILGLNTHLDHDAFDRNARKGHKYIYIDFTCSHEDTNFIKQNFDVQIIRDYRRKESLDGAVESAQFCTFAFKLIDKAGALWDVLDTIGNRGINVLGVNTYTERESTSGYKYNNVKCFCSDRNIHQLQADLTAIGAINVKFQLLVETALLTKGISYLVRDQPGALANTLEIFRDLGLNISGVNLEHMGGICRDREGGLRLNFVECSIDEDTRNDLFEKLMKDYGAVDVALYEVPVERLHDDPNYKIVKITIRNIKGSLNRALEAFSDLHVNLYGVNVLKPSFNRDFTINYKHYHLEITVTSEQERELKDRLYARGLAIDVMSFDLKKYIDREAMEQQQNPDVATKSDREDESGGAPETKTIELSVRDEVGALANALQICCDLGINITKVNPAHLSQVHKSEYVECSCEPEKRNLLIEKLKSKCYGATQAVFLPKDEVPKNPAADAHLNYCVIKFSVGNKTGAIVDALKAFPELGVNIIKVNPPHIKLQNQYVECCCAEEVKTKVVNKMKAITGVTHVHVLTDTEVTKEHEDPNYCVIKFTVGDSAGIIVRALRVFFDNNVNIIGVNTLTPAFERKSMVKFKKNNVEFLATEEKAFDLKHKLLVTGVALDAEEYKPREPSHEQHEEYEPEEPSHEEHEHENAIKLTSIKVLPN